MKALIFSFFFVFPVSQLFAQQSNSTYNLECSGETYDGNFYVTTSIRAKLIVKGQNDYTLEDGLYNLLISYAPEDEMLASDLWHQESNVAFESTNFKNYNPRVYTDHAKFSDMASIFGTVDFIVPHSVMFDSTKQDYFTAYTILSWVADHWGDTVSMNCSMKNNDPAAPVAKTGSECFLEAERNFYDYLDERGYEFEGFYFSQEGIDEDGEASLIYSGHSNFWGGYGVDDVYVDPFTCAIKYTENVYSE